MTAAMAIRTPSCPCGAGALQKTLTTGTEIFARCVECGLFTRTQPHPQGGVDRCYRDDYWEHFRAEQLSDSRHNLYRHVMEWVQEWHPQPGRLVDVGCGAGRLLADAVQRRWSAVGFDLSAQSVAHARAQGLEVHEQGWPPCGLPDDSVDVVTLVNALDHLTAPFLALREAWRVLRPGGLLYIRLPNAPIHIVLKQLALRWPFSILGFGCLPVVHRFGFGQMALQYHLRQTAFELMALRVAPPSDTFAYSMETRRRERFVRSLKMIDRLLYRSMAACGLDRRAWGLSLEAMARKPT
jgi:SAM-dependent methyltransferase